MNAAWYDASFLALLQEKTKRRQKIARHIRNVWTHSNSELAGMASPIFDGRFDALSCYVIEYYEMFSSDSKHFPSNAVEDSCFKENGVDLVHADDLPYHDFCQKYMFKNLPVVIRGLADTWSCFRNWTKKDHDKNRTVPDIFYLKEHFGSDVVSVHQQLSPGFSCTQQRPDVSLSFEMTLSDYVEWWTRYLNDNTDQPLLYLKDWKFASLHPSYDAYSCPALFHDDWLNEAKNGMYRFVYLGPKGTATALHADVLRSFSWSTNVCGRKRWYLVPPLHSHLLYDCFGAKLAYHFFADVSTDEGSGSVSFISALFPGLRIARQFILSVVQDAGDTIFVPSNWFHTVENIADTLSINHNWLNGANLHQCWCYVNAEVRSSTSEGSEESLMISETSLLGYSSVAEMTNDVALSFWHVVGAKAKELSQGRLNGTSSTVFQMDLDGILFAIDGLLELESDGFVSMCALNRVHDIVGIRSEILNLLNE